MSKRRITEDFADFVKNTLVLFGKVQNNAIVDSEVDIGLVIFEKVVDLDQFSQDDLAQCALNDVRESVVIIAFDLLAEWGDDVIAKEVLAKDGFLIIQLVQLLVVFAFASVQPLKCLSLDLVASDLALKDSQAGILVNIGAWLWLSGESQNGAQFSSVVVQLHNTVQPWLYNTPILLLEVQDGESVGIGRQTPCAGSKDVVIATRSRLRQTLCEVAVLNGAGLEAAGVEVQTVALDLIKDAGQIKQIIIVLRALIVSKDVFADSILESKMFLVDVLRDNIKEVVIIQVNPCTQKSTNMSLQVYI